MTELSSKKLKSSKKEKKSTSNKKRNVETVENSTQENSNDTWFTYSEEAWEFINEFDELELKYELN